MARQLAACGGTDAARACACVRGGQLGGRDTWHTGHGPQTRDVSS
jgi:hypothetical protein